jgi:hypothetical protein
MRRHLLEGWGGLTLFISLGAVLEFLLAFKVSLYVRADQETLRLMWRLAHGHGTLLALLHLAFASSLTQLNAKHFPQPAGLISGALSAGTLLIPAGFFLGGVAAQGGDPGPAIALVPAGAVLLIFATVQLFLRFLKH